MPLTKHVSINPQTVCPNRYYVIFGVHLKSIGIPLPFVDGLCVYCNVPVSRRQRVNKMCFFVNVYVDLVTLPLTTGVDPNQSWYEFVSLPKAYLLICRVHTNIILSSTPVKMTRAANGGDSGRHF